VTYYIVCDQSVTKYVLLHFSTLITAINHLMPNDLYICRTAALTSRRYILYIYSTNIHTEYFKPSA